MKGRIWLLLILALIAVFVVGNLMKSEERSPAMQQLEKALNPPPSMLWPNEWQNKVQVEIDRFCRLYLESESEVEREQLRRELTQASAEINRKRKLFQ